MTAETLRRAAALMRERSEDAVLVWGERPWATSGLGWDDRQGTTYDVTSPEGLLAATPCEELSEHIASWHPAVALAVAAWLDEKAASYDASEDTWTRGAADPRNGWEDRQLTVAQNLAHHFQHPLAVARTYLGEIESFRPDGGGAA